MVRLTSSAALRVASEVFEPRSRGDLALSCLHALLVAPPLSCDSLFRATERALVRHAMRLANGVACLVTRGDGMLVVLALNESDTAAAVRAECYCKSAVARARGAIALESDADAAASYAAKTKAQADARGPAARQRGPRWPAKWKAFRATATLAPKSQNFRRRTHLKRLKYLDFGIVECCNSRTALHRQQLLLVVARSGVQFELGEIDCSLAACDEPQAGGKTQRSIVDFCERGAKRTRAVAVGAEDGVFAALPLRDDARRAALHRRDDDHRARGFPERLADAELEAALEASRRDRFASSDAADRPERRADADLAAAIEASRRDDRGPSDDLAAAIQASLLPIRPRPIDASAVIVLDDDHDDVDVEDREAPSHPNDAAALREARLKRFA